MPWRTRLGPFPGRGAGVTDQKSPVLSSRTNSASLAGSSTGSFGQGVSRRSWLLSAHVHESPRSVVMQPKFGLAMTLVQGAGGSPRLSGTISYDRPSGAKPPNPFENCNRWEGSSGVDGGGASTTASVATNGGG